MLTSEHEPNRNYWRDKLGLTDAEAELLDLPTPEQAKKIEAGEMGVNHTVLRLRRLQE